MYTVDELLDKYETDRLPKLGARSQRDYRQYIRVLRQQFGSKRAADLRSRDIEQFRDNASTGRHHRERMISVLRVTFSHAVDRGWLETNPCSRLERLQSSRPKHALTDDEFEAAKRLARPSSVRLVMELALLTGQTQDTILRLRWSQVHRDRGFILFRNNRTKKKVEVTITPSLETVLDECSKLSDKREFVICSRRGGAYTNEGFRTSFQRVMSEWELTGNDRFTFHDIQDKWKRDKESSSVGRDLRSVVEEYPQFSSAVRDEAAQMSVQYELFYCLEKSIRSLISQVMNSADGTEWWDAGRIPSNVHQEVAKRLQVEIDSGMTQRSERMIDYTTFGELSTIITTNWPIFQPTFTSQAAVRSVMRDLNLLRGPIAHCSSMSADEVARLKLTVKDWFRLRRH